MVLTNRAVYNDTDVPVAYDTDTRSAYVDNFPFVIGGE
jgi:hypothetical protein